MKTAIAIRHIHFEDLGTLEPLLRERGYAVRHVDATVDDLAALDAQAPDVLALLGGDSDRAPGAPCASFRTARTPG